MTELETARSRLPDVQLTVDTLLQSGDKEFAELAHTLSVEDLVIAGAALVAVTKVSSVRVGLTAYEIRQQTPDGEWGRRKFDLAEQWEVSDRTIQRWMRSAQDHFQLQLTPAQMNAEYSSPPDTSRPEGDQSNEPEWDWDDDEGDAGFGDLEGYTAPSAGGDGSLLGRMNDEAGWGDEALPSAEYANAPDAPAVTPVPMALEPDDTWVAFTMQSIQAEHENFSDVAAERSAKARWARKIQEDPLDLLDELETIYEAHGETLPDEVAATLLEAEEQKPIKPDEVTEGKKKKGRSGPKFAYDVAEKLLTTARQLHEQVHVGLREGTMTDKEAAAMLPHLVPIPHTVANLKKMAEEARKRHLAKNPPVEEKIAATVAAEEAEADF